ncbi:two-component system sensor histidine kinase RppB [Coleofasciculus sp. G2-EDA-02]|uniref:two-component system sensor histidine kinase RppB n=1 Tax=Coleofasciculus sp. G2-EDA-02 TaxID=3069529 RepID=UPI0032FD4BFC
MNQNQLFRSTRWRLAGWYAGVMGLILGVSGFGVYEAIAHAHRVSANQELKSVAGMLHDSLEPTLRQPGRLETAAKRRLPNLCLMRDRTVDNQTQSTLGEFCTAERHTSPAHRLSAIHQGDYFIRFFDKSGQLIAQSGSPPQQLSTELIPENATEQSLLTLKDTSGLRYRHLVLALDTPTNELWGYLQVGRSLADFDDYLASVRIMMLLGLPLAMLLVGVAAWWLAELAMRPIYQSYQQIQQFTADAAHELRTPLAAIRATVESVLRLACISEAESRETLQVIERQNYRLSQLVSDLLLLSRLDRKIQHNQWHLCCIQDLLNDIEEELAALAMTQQIKLTTDIQVDQPIQVLGDEEQLYRLIFNIVVNALHYTPAGGQVKVSLDCRDQWVLIHIQDTGIGIAPEHQKHIFDRFYRINSDRARVSGGSGLGLSIARAIAQAHQGTIQVHSESGKGSQFTIRLPKSV